MKSIEKLRELCRKHAPARNIVIDNSKPYYIKNEWHGNNDDNMGKIEFQPSEVKAALASCSMTQEMLAQHINRALKTSYTTEYINKIILRKRTNDAIERTIWDVVGNWIEASRAIHTDSRVVMPDRFACADIANQNQQNN